MVAVVAKIFLVKLFLPLFFLVGAALRPSFISLGYVLLALTCNVLPTSKINGPFPKVTRVFTFLCVILTLAITLVQFGYQLYQHFDHPEEEEYVELCNKSTFVYWTRQIGFIRVPATTDPNALRLFFPELLALFGSLVTFIACTAYPTDLSLTASTDRQPLEAEEHLETTLENDQQQTRAQLVQGPTSKNYADIVNVASKRTSDACVVFSICIIGMLSPSLLNAPYFLFTLVSLTWWALYTPLRRSKFNAMKQALLIYSAFHFVFLYTYQIEFFQENVPSTGIEARLIGLSALVLPSDCEKWYELVVNWNLGWIPYANLASVLVLYYVLTLQYRWTKEGVKQKHSPSGNRNSAQTGTGDDLQEGLLSNTREIESTDAIALQRITSEVMDRQKISQLIRSRRESEPGFMLIRAAQEFLYFSLYHCYVFALLAMLMWAMLYHSVFGLIFLVLTCFLWALVDSRNWTFRMSPLLLAYVEFLILTQYVCSMNFLPDELQLSQAMNIIGFKLEKTRIDAFLALLLKALLSIPFFVLLRLHLREHFYNSLSARDRLQQINYGTFDESPTSARKNLVQRVARKFSLDGEERPFAWISRLLTKYWIFLVAFCILINSPIPQHLDPKINEDNLFNIGFFIFFVALILILNVSFRLFQNIIFAFFTLLIIYSSVVLVSIYCYQFDGIPALWHNWTHLSEEQDASIGLTVYSKGEFGNLFKDLIKLITLIVVTMLQLKFFHSPWLRLVQMRDAASHVGDDVECADAARIDIRSLIMRATQIWSDFKELLWRCAEVHLHKFVLFILLVVCVNHFCALNLVPVIFISLALCSSAISPLVSFSTCVYLGMVFIARRIYQLPIVPPISSLVNETANCSDVVGDDARKEFDSFEKWIGLSKQYTDEDDWLAGDIYGFITVLILIGMQLAIRYRQVHSRKLRGLPEPEQGIIFVGHEPGNFDKSLVDCAKFLLNYGFYKFGIEISFVAMAFVAWFRMDCLAALLMLWLLVLFPMTRSGRKRVWPLLVFYLAIVFPLQYAMAIGLPTNLCIGYPWTWWKPVDLNGWVLLNNNLLYFLGLPNYRKEAARFLPNLLVDFILLAVVAAQKRVFLKEGEHHPAGSNESIYKNGKYELFKQNPRYDFVVEQRSFVDFFKYFIFMYGHWCTMIMVLGAGLGGTSVFALGYLILAFWMLWKGNNLYTMQNYQRTLARWDILSMYTITVMCCKVLIQVVGCAFIGLLFHRCGIQQLFGIFCVDNKLSEELKAFFELNEKVPVVQNVSKCATTESHSEAKIGFDALAFLFIIFQLRILQSWFFQRCMIEFRCEIIQANRGAVLINQLVEKEMREQTEQQNRKLREIQDRTAAIRKRYEEQQRRSSGSNYFLPQTYGQAKRAGDYYMFDYGPDTDELVEPVQSFVPEVTPGAGDFDKLDPAQLLHTALGKDLNLTGTLDSVEEAEQIKDEKLRMIAAVAPSKKAREIAKLALIQRHEKRGSLDAVEEDQQPQTSSSAKAREVPDMPLIQMRKKTAEEEENIEKEEEETRPDGNVEEEQTWGQTVSSLIRFVWKMFLAVLGWAAAFLNRRSREHRYVSYVLNKEKERLKELMDDELFTSQISNAELRTKWEQQNMHMVSSEADIRRLENEAHNRWEERNIFARFVTAIGNSVSAHTDIICYAFAVFVHGHTAGLISLPLPALIFFWGTLANPRPSKYFWIVMIFYTEFEIVVKFLFQFGFWPWNTTTDLVQNTAKTYKTQYVFGVQKADYFAVPDVALLIALFFHRYMLRKLGLWRDANSDQLSVSQGGGGKAMKKGTSNEGSSQKSGQISPNTQSTATASNGEVGYQAGEETVQIQEIDVEKGETRGTNDALEIKGQANSEGEPLGVVCHFFDKLIHPKFRYIRDFYPLMFFLDVICMLIVVFGYNSFGEGSSGDVVNDIKSNKIPIPLVVIILIQSMMIVIDRGLYLRKAVVCKLGYHLLTVCLVHIWILFILPSFTHREAHDNTLARYLYFIKCIYFLVSAWQIRNGYPSLCIGNLLTHSYGLVNMVLFKIFMLTPFVFELRTAIDWTWTDTSMPIFDFFNMENFYAVIYNLKCARKFEESFPAPRGEAKGRVIKYMMGLPLIIFLIFLVWSPIIMFALINTIGNIQMPESVQMSVGLEGYPPVYKMEAKGDQIASISVVQYDELVKIFSNMDSRLTEPSVQDRSRAAVYYISQYTQMDILRVRFRPESESSWQISSESMDALKTALQDSQRPLKISVQMEFKRPASEKKDPQVHSATFKADINNTNLYEALNSPGSWFETTNLLPMYLSIPSQGEAQTAKVLYEAAVRKQKNSPLPPLNSSYNTWRMKLSGPVQDSSYWITQVDLNANMTELNILPPEHVNYGTDRNLNYTEFIAMVDRVFPSWLDSYVQGGIILMYAGVVLLVGRLLRGFVSSQPLDVIINEIPNPDYLLKICLDIYLVREASDFVLEQDLFAKLIFLFRSPQTLIRWTRYKTKNE